MKTYYEILKCDSFDISENDLANQYYMYSELYGSNGALKDMAIFAQVNEAFKFLSNKTCRENYTRLLRQGLGHAEASFEARLQIAIDYLFCRQADLKIFLSDKIRKPDYQYNETDFAALFVLAHSHWLMVENILKLLDDCVKENSTLKEQLSRKLYPALFNLGSKTIIESMLKEVEIFIAEDKLATVKKPEPQPVERQASSHKGVILQPQAPTISLAVHTKKIQTEKAKTATLKAQLEDQKLLLEKTQSTAQTMEAQLKSEVSLIRHQLAENHILIQKKEEQLRLQQTSYNGLNQNYLTVQDELQQSRQTIQDLDRQLQDLRTEHLEDLAELTESFNDRAFRVQNEAAGKAANYLLKPDNAFYSLANQLRATVVKEHSPHLLPLIDNLLSEMEKSSKDNRLHVQTLMIVQQLLLDPNPANIQNCINYAEKSAYKGSTRQVVGGCLLAIAGVLVIGLAVTLAFSASALFLGLTAPFALEACIPIGLIGVGMVGSGVALASRGRESSVYSPLLSLFKEIAKPQVEAVEGNLDQQPTV